MKFSHLHCHTQYSLLDGAANISSMFKKAKNDGMPAVAITDHGNMFGVFQFVAEAGKFDGVKPIVGCEFYLVENRFEKTFTKDKKDKRYHQLFLAKNTEGYRNLSKMCSTGYIEGMYSKYPRIDKALVLQYHKGLIATTCCLGASVPQAILKHGEAAGRKEFEWWLNIFQEDYYVELQRHNLKEQILVNEVLLRFAKEYNVKVIASNDSHYVDKNDANAHDILLCINTGEKQSTPKMDDVSMDDDANKKNARFAFPNDEFYFKTTAEMTHLFKDVPEAIDNTNEIVGKVEHLKLKQDIMLPNFVIPDGFKDQDDYLYDLTYKGAKERYKDLTPEVEERINFELFTIKTMGFAGYFLIVADFIKAGRDLGVLIGPGRGSAAGSAVAYCIGITNIDPIKYKLLFERFLNPDRKSMPDIDTDFDDEGRQKVIDYVVEKYGRKQVAQIVTYGTMAAKMSIKDVARVMDLPLNDANGLAKLVSDKPGIKLNRLMNAALTGDGSLVDKEGLASEDIENAKQLREILADTNDPRSKVLKEALVLEGSVRGTGVHAAGIIIAPKDLTEIIPVATAKDSDLLLTQFEGNVIEDSGVIKMDFLGLKTLTIIRDALILIKQNHNVTIDIDNIPLDDKKTYELYQRGDTNATFQFESAGMQKYLKDLKPDRFDELIAMNALYRPGPIAYIPNFINRKLGKEQVVYDLPEMEEYLGDTYGICVSGDTLVYNPVTGERARIDALEDRVKEFYVQGVDENLESQIAPITYWVCNGKKKVLQVRLKNGSTVKLTPNHRVLTENGWKEIGELQKGECIAIPRHLDLMTPQYFDRQQLRVLAYLLADGALSGSGATAEFVSKDEKLLAEYISCLEGFDRLEPRTLQQIREVTRVMVAGTEKTHYHETNSLVKALRNWGLKTMKGGCTSDTKFIPDFVFKLSNPDIAFFLASLWDCDGHIGKRLCFMKTISKQMAYDIQTLLLRLGIHTAIYEAYYHNNRRNHQMTAYQITVYNLKVFKDLIEPYLVSKTMHSLSHFTGIETTDAVSRSLFLEEFTESWKGSKRQFMQEYGLDRQHLYANALKTRSRINVSIIESVKEILDIPQTKRNLNVRWIGIDSITSAGEELVYDITVDKIHNFVGNNIILHNCVYQEQVMLLSQKLANFSKGDADVLRKAMGKKQIAVLNKMKTQYLQGCEKNGLDLKKCEKIWSDWEAFASYAFNKSHSTCYALVAYQTAYLKAHYTGEYMAAVLTNNMSNIDKITFFMEECRNMGVPVKGPDVNESDVRFAVNDKGDIRFALSAIKGVGEAAVESLIEERKKGGKFKDIFDFISRLNLRTVNKKVLESLAQAGAFDGFGYTRATFFAPSDKYDSFIEHLLKYGAGFQSQKANASTSLFGESASDSMMEPPSVPKANEWNLIQKLNYERDCVGIYLSGHPLDDFKMEMAFGNVTLDRLPDVRNQKVKLAAFVSSATQRIAQNGNQWGFFTIQDYTGSHEFRLFKENYARFSPILQPGSSVFIEGEMRTRFNSEEYELNIKDIRFLGGLSEDLTESITIQIPIEQITEGLISNLELLCKNHKGKHKLKVNFIDSVNRQTLNLFSPERKVHVDTDFVAALDKEGLTYKVN